MKCVLKKPLKLCIIYHLCMFALALSRPRSRVCLQVQRPPSVARAAKYTSNPFHHPPQHPLRSARLWPPPRAILQGITTSRTFQTLPSSSNTRSAKYSAARAPFHGFATTALEGITTFLTKRLPQGIRRPPSCDDVSSLHQNPSIRDAFGQNHIECIHLQFALLEKAVKWMDWCSVAGACSHASYWIWPNSVGCDPGCIPLMASGWGQLWIIFGAPPMRASPEDSMIF